MGGSGPSGEVAFPAYIGNTHAILLAGRTTGAEAADLDVSLMDVMNTMLGPGGNPHVGTFMNPAGSFAVSQTEFDSFKSALTDLIPTEEWAGTVDSVQVKLDDVIQRISVQFETLADGATERLNTAQEEVDVDLDPITDWQGIIQAAITKLDTAGVRTTVDANAVLSSAIANATEILTAAAAGAASAANDPALQPLFDALAARVETQKARNIREFASGMADINAVHSSAFLTGIALINSEATIALAGMQAEIITRIYNAALSAYNTGLSSVIGGRVEMELSNIRSRDGLLGQAVQGMIGLLGSKTDYKRALLGLYAQTFMGSVEAELRAAGANASARHQMLSQHTEGILRLVGSNMDNRYRAAQLQGELSRVKVAGMREYSLDEKELDEKFALWDIGVFEKGGNILAAPSGMAAVIPNTRSNGSALGGGIGAVAGGIVGSIVPGVGTAIGASIGGALGSGIGGMF